MLVVHQTLPNSLFQEIKDMWQKDNTNQTLKFYQILFFKILFRLGVFITDNNTAKSFDSDLN